MQELDGARNIDLPNEKLESGSGGGLIKLVGQLRDHRNELNQIVSERAFKRSGLNVKTCEKVDEAQKYREKRDEMNSQVQGHKQSHNELNAKADKPFDEVDGMKSDLKFDNGKDIGELKGEIKQLEFHQQTEVLSIEDRREFIEEVENKREELRRKKDKAGESGDLEELIEEVGEVRSEVSQYHQRVAKLVDDAQEHHNQMIETYREADDIRGKADKIHELFVEARGAADRHHRDFVRIQKRLHELDRKEERQHKGSRAEGHEAAKAETEEVYQKFKEGETLETEDLMKLQKSGLL